MTTLKRTVSLSDVLQIKCGDASAVVAHPTLPFLERERHLDQPGISIKRILDELKEDSGQSVEHESRAESADRAVVQAANARHLAISLRSSAIKLTASR